MDQNRMKLSHRRVYLQVSSVYFVLTNILLVAILLSVGELVTCLARVSTE